MWTMRNKMVIELVFLWRTTNSIFKFLAFLQHWHPQSRQRDCDRLGHMMDAMTDTARQLASPQASWDSGHLVVFFLISFLLSLGMFEPMPQQTILFLCCTWTSCMDNVVALLIKRYESLFWERGSGWWPMLVEMHSVFYSSSSERIACVSVLSYTNMLWSWHLGFCGENSVWEASS